MRIDRTRLAVRCQDVKPGDWFLPVSAEGKDQHFLIPEALRRGAVGFVYENGRFDPSPFAGIPSFGVADLRATLFGLAEENRARLGASVAVVAGSYGKSTVKEMVASIFRAGAEPGSTHFSPANWNTKPLLAAQMAALGENCRTAVFEMGARRVGDFDVPLAFLKPQLVCLLNIGRAHLGEFGSLAALESTKLSCLHAPSARTLVVPRDHDGIFARARLLGRRILSFGTHAESDVRLLGESENRLELAHRSSRLTLELPWQAPGKGLNTAAAAAMALGLGLEWESLKPGLEGFAPLSGRFELRTWRGRLVVDDAYNSSPESLLAGISQFFRMKASNRAVLVLGSMLELGEQSRRIHQELGGSLAAFQRAGDWLLTVGEGGRILGEAARAGGWQTARHCDTAEEARAVLVENPSDWSAAYVKGSKSTGLHGLLGEAGA
jgi:UDP-N-acetylmuramoyl-tripeptide--D-alanyl-D-alanine ligase